MLIKIYLTLLFCLLSMFSITSFSSQDWQNPEYIFKAFKEIALKNEYRPTQQKILKWTQPIVYQFKYHQIPTNQLIEELFRHQFQHLQSITGHPIKRDNTNPNLTIHLTPDENYGSVIKSYTNTRIKNLNSESHCMASIQTSSLGEITNAQIVLPVDHVFSRGLLVSCVIEETTQIMGLPNDSDWVYPSIANDRSKIVFLSGLDYIMLKILYSQNIRPGEKGKSLDKKLKQLILGMSQNNQIQQATERVSQQGLYPLVN